jgi:dTDP-glucose 4,6-dehydratase
VQSYSLSPDDLNHVLTHTQKVWEELRGGRIFLTGGTGFFGMWLVESFLWANESLDLKAEMVVLSRDPGKFVRLRPHLAARRALSFHQGDLCDFAYPAGRFSHAIHAATPTTGSQSLASSVALVRTIVQGTERLLDFACHAGVAKVLLTSSGAVYGRQPPELSHVPEDYAGSPDPMAANSTYGHGKRLAEHLCAIYAKNGPMECKIARCFAFVGPYLPLDAHFAIGNFIRDGFRGGPIAIQGDGTPYRSYMYAADLAVWLWTILVRGAGARPYNVGSDAAITIADLARATAAAFRTMPKVHIAREPEPGKPAERYVPSTERAREELGLSLHIALPESIERTVQWHLNRSASPLSIPF